MFSGLEWEFPVTEITTFVTQYMSLIMPLLVLIVGVLLALLVVEGVVGVLLKVLGFVAGVQPSGIGSPNHETSLGLDDDREFG